MSHSLPVFSFIYNRFYRLVFLLVFFFRVARSSSCWLLRPCKEKSIADGPDKTRETTARRHLIIDWAASGRAPLEKQRCVLLSSPRDLTRLTHPPHVRLFKRLGKCFQSFSIFFLSVSLLFFRRRCLGGDGCVTCILTGNGCSLSAGPSICIWLRPRPPLDGPT